MYVHIQYTYSYHRTPIPGQPRHQRYQFDAVSYWCELGNWVATYLQLRTSFCPSRTNAHVLALNKIGSATSFARLGKSSQEDIDVCVQQLSCFAKIRIPSQMLVLWVCLSLFLCKRFWPLGFTCIPSPQSSGLLPSNSLMVMRMFCFRSYHIRIKLSSVRVLLIITLAACVPISLCLNGPTNGSNIGTQTGQMLFAETLLSSCMHLGRMPLQCYSHCV